MQKPFKIKVSGFEETGSVLDVVQALGLVRDFFGILKGDDKNILLDIHVVARDNPLTVECVPYNEETQEIDYDGVEQNASDFVRVCNAVLSENPHSPRDVSQATKKKMKRLLQCASRNNFQTRCNLGPVRHSVVIDPGPAYRAARILQYPTIERYPYLHMGKDKGHELGGIDGEIVEINRRGEVPALLIADRAWRKNVWCILSDSETQKWGEKLTLADVWDGTRVSIHGELVYNRIGLQLNGVKDGFLHIVEVPDYEIDIDDLYDPDFTGGLSTKEFLRRRWEGVDSSSS